MFTGIRKTTVAGVLAAFAVLAGVGASSASGTGGPLQGLEHICLSQGGTFIPDSQIGSAVVPECILELGDLTIPNEIGPGESRAARSKLLAAEKLCQAAGFAGISGFAKAFGPGFSQIAVLAWWCWTPPGA